MPLSKSIQIGLDAGEAMQLRQILRERLHDELLRFAQDPEAIQYPLVYNVYVKNINKIKEFIQLLESPLVEQGYLDFEQQEFLVYLPIGSFWSLTPGSA